MYSLERTAGQISSRTKDDLAVSHVTAETSLSLPEGVFCPLKDEWHDFIELIY